MGRKKLATPEILEEYIEWLKIGAPVPVAAKLVGLSTSVLRPALHGEQFARAVKAAIRHGRLAKKMRDGG